MCRFTIRELVLLTLVVFGACGCNRKARIIHDGIEGVDKHASQIDEASRPGGESAQSQP